MAIDPIIPGNVVIPMCFFQAYPAAHPAWRNNSYRHPDHHPMIALCLLVSPHMVMFGTVEVGIIVWPVYLQNFFPISFLLLFPIENHPYGMETGRMNMIISWEYEKKIQYVDVYYIIISIYTQIHIYVYIYIHMGLKYHDQLKNKIILWLSVKYHIPKW